MKHWKFRAAAIIVIVAALLTGTLRLVNDDRGESGPEAFSRFITALTGVSPAREEGTEALTAEPSAEPAPTTDPGATPVIDYEPPATAAPTGGTIPIGGVDISIEGDGKAPERVENVAPNQRIPKDFHVDNQGSADVYVFMAVTVPYVTIASQKADGTYQPPMSQPLYSFRANPGWLLVEDRVSSAEATYVYAYATDDGEGGMTLLGPGRSTGRIFDELVTLNYVEGKLDGTEGEVIAQAYAIQAANLGEGAATPAAIWALVKNGEATRGALQ